MTYITQTTIVLFVLSAIFCTIVSFTTFGLGQSEYKFIWLLPTVYLINLAFFASMLQKKSGAITVWSSIVLLFLQTVLFPLLLSGIGEDFTGRRYINLTSRTISESIFAIAFGNFVFGFLAFIMHELISKKKDKSDRIFDVSIIEGSRVLYYSFILLATVLFLIIGLPNKLLSLFVKVRETVEDPGSLLLLVRQVAWSGIALTYVIVLERTARKYRTTPRYRYFVIALLASVLITGVIYGDRRSMQLFTGVLVIYLLSRNFPRKVGTIISLVGIAMISTFVALSLFRFEQQGAIEGMYLAFVDFDLAMQLLAETVQIYFGGVDSIALGIEFSRSEDIALSDMVFDFGRTFFGPSFFLKDSGLILSQQYNDFIYDGRLLNGQLLFAVSYGVALFGFLGAPVFLIINFVYSLLLENWLKSTRSFEMQFLIGFCLLRVATNLLVNTPTINSVVTLQFMTLGLVILVARLLKNIDRPYRSRNSL